MDTIMKAEISNLEKELHYPESKFPSGCIGDKTQYGPPPISVKAAQKLTKIYNAARDQRDVNSMEYLADTMHIPIKLVDSDKEIIRLDNKYYESNDFEDYIEYLKKLSKALKAEPKPIFNSERTQSSFTISIVPDNSRRNDATNKAFRSYLKCNKENHRQKLASIIDKLEERLRYSKYYQEDIKPKKDLFSLIKQKLYKLL